MSTTTPPSLISLIDTTTILSLLLVLVLLLAAYALSLRTLRTSTPTSWRILFIWHIFDALIHLIFEGSFLYNCLFTSIPFNPATHHPALITNFLGRPDRLYGSRYADNWASKLWMVYAQADARWAEADLTVVSLEILTVGIGAPLAAWVAYMIARGDWRVSFWMTVLATGELYGGFMTFAPEWLTANKNLDGSNPLFLWVFLVFFNMLWVVIPLYALWVAYGDIKNAFLVRDGVVVASVRRAEERRGKKSD